MKTVTEFIVDNWYVFIIIVCALVCAIMLIENFIKLPTERKKTKIKEWLKTAVDKADKTIETENGQAKLLLVYTWFVKRFPFTAIFMDFNAFKKLVDEVLDKIEDTLD